MCFSIKKKINSRRHFKVGFGRENKYNNYRKNNNNIKVVDIFLYSKYNLDTPLPEPNNKDSRF